MLVWAGARVAGIRVRVPRQSTGRDGERQSVHSPGRSRALAPARSAFGSWCTCCIYATVAGGVPPCAPGPPTRWRGACSMTMLHMLHAPPPACERRPPSVRAAHARGGRFCVCRLTQSSSGERHAARVAWARATTTRKEHGAHTARPAETYARHDGLYRSGAVPTALLPSLLLLLPAPLPPLSLPLCYCRLPLAAVPSRSAAVPLTTSLHLKPLALLSSGTLRPLLSLPAPPALPP